MIEFEESGYIAHSPIGPDRWREVCADAPEGLVVSHNSVPPGFLLIQNYLGPDECDAIVRECDALQGVRHTVGAAGAGAAGGAHQSQGRTSEMVDIRALSMDIVGAVREAYVQSVAPHYGGDIEWFELPEILRYRAGGEYKPHADSENWIASERQWRRVIDRDLSILLYLNEGFTGGEIAFPNFGFTLAPKRGLLIAFPSDGRYVHAARPVTSGVRYALVSWAAMKGSERVSGPRPHAVQV